MSKGTNMSTAKAPNGDETHVRAIVFKECDGYIAQCLEYDICAQAPDITSLLDRFEMTVEAEFSECHRRGKEARDCIPPAPQLYWQLWDKRSVLLQRIAVASPTARKLDIALAA